MKKPSTSTEKAIKTGQRQAPYLLELRKKDGARRLFQVDESPIKDKSGRVIAIVGAPAGCHRTKNC